MSVRWVLYVCLFACFFLGFFILATRWYTLQLVLGGFDGLGQLLDLQFEGVGVVGLLLPLGLRRGRLLLAALQLLLRLFQLLVANLRRVLHLRTRETQNDYRRKSRVTEYNTEETLGRP